MITLISRMPILPVMLVCGLSGSLAQTPPYDESDFLYNPEPAMITIEGDTVFFDGETSEESWQALSLLDQKGALEPVTRMVILSPGGETVAARKIARWVQEHIEVLEVDGICFSSCANYIFPAAPRKIIRAEALVGWHGSERSGEIVSLNYPGISAAEFERSELQEAILFDQPELEGTEELILILNREFDVFEKTRADEKRFFEEIKVDEKITYYGLLPGQYDRYLQSGRDGWTFSLADMARFGITNITYAGQGSYTSSQAVQEQVNIIALGAE